MSFEQVAKLQVLAQDVGALVRTETLQLGGVFATIHAGGEGAALEAVAAKTPPAEPGFHGARLDDGGDRPGRDRQGAEAGQGRGLARPGLLGEPDPAEHWVGGDAGGRLPGGEGAHRAEIGVAVGQGDDDGASLRALGLRRGEPQAALPSLEVLDAHSGELRTAQGAGERDQEQGTVAQAARVLRDWSEDLAEDGDGGGQLLGRRFAGRGGLAADAGHGFRDLCLGGGHRAAGEEMGIANGRPAQDDGVDREAPAALGGEEGEDVRGGRAGRGVGTTRTKARRLLSAFARRV